MKSFNKFSLWRPLISSAYEELSNGQTVKRSNGGRRRFHKFTLGRAFRSWADSVLRHTASQKGTYNISRLVFFKIWIFFGVGSVISRFLSARGCFTKMICFQSFNNRSGEGSEIICTAWVKGSCLLGPCTYITAVVSCVQSNTISLAWCLDRGVLSILSAETNSLLVYWFNNVALFVYF